MRTRLINLVAVILMSIVALPALNAQSLSGNYTIDANSTASGNYTSVAAAATALTSNGVSGPVIFTISDGTYSGQVNFGNGITGASATNTISFLGKSNDSSKVIITNSSSYVIYSTGADYINFSDITLKQTGSSYTIYLNGNSDNWKFKNCAIVTSSTGYNIYNYRNNYNEWHSCRIVGGSNGFYNYGVGTGANNNVGLVIKDCDIVKYSSYGIYDYYLANTEISGNYIDSCTGSNGYGIRSYYCNNQIIRDNEMYGNSYGFYLYYENYTKYGKTDNTVIYNNIMRENSNYGMYSSNSNNIALYHNVFESTGSNYPLYITTSGLVDWSVANNVIVATGSPTYGMYVSWGGGTNLPKYWDYNAYWFPNASNFAAFNNYGVNSLATLKSLFSGAYNQNSVEVDPEFVNNNDGRVYANGLNNVGVDMGVNTDIDGNERPNSIDKKIDIGPNDFYLYDQDADVFDLVSPLSLIIGNNTVKAVFKNGGSKDITNTTLDVHYSADGGKNWVSEKLDVKSLAPGKTIEYEFSNKLTITTAGNYTISVKIDKQISGDPDKEDEKHWDICTGIAGNFYIGSGANADFKTLTDATNKLKCGISGPVVFHVQPGTYNEQVKIDEVLGASALNTVTFKSGGIDSVTITYNSEGTVSLIGADYVSFENFKIAATGTSGAAVFITKGADYNRFSSCIIMSDTNSTSSQLNPLVISSGVSDPNGYGNNGNYNLFEENEILGGYYGAIMLGTSSNVYSEGNNFLKNNFRKSYSQGMYFYYNSGVVFHDNVIKDLRNTGNTTGIYVYFISNFDWQRNTVININYANYFAYANLYQYKNVRSTFANNKISGKNSQYGLYAYYLNYTDFWHNSISGEGSYLFNCYYSSQSDIRNNIFHYTGTNYLFYTYNPTFLKLDYNNFYNPNGILAYINNVQYPTMVSFQDWNISLNKNNYELDPQFVDQYKDLHSTASSPEMIGVNIGVLLDGDMDTRCLIAPALGADEIATVYLPPVAGFSVPDTAWLNSTVNILNSTKPNKRNKTTWYVNNVMVSDSAHLVYTPNFVGTDTIKQVIESCGGKDSTTQTLFVSPTLRKPIVDFASSNRSIYANETIRLKDLSENGATSWKWKVSPAYQYDPILQFYNRTHDYNVTADSTSANPVLTFNYSGIYEVCLVVENQYGKDSVCRSQYIIVKDKYIACQSFKSTTSTNGTLFDDGGENGNYSQNLNGLNLCVSRIESCEGSIEFDILKFDLSSGDYLRVYDGKTNDGKPLWDIEKYPKGMNGNLSDPSVMAQFTASTGSAYIEFETDDIATGAGFEIDWNVKQQAFVSPTADISLPDTACVGFPVYFENSSTGIYSSIEWDIENDGIVEGYDDQQAYTFSKVGTYDVKLNALSYCAASNSITKKIVIINPAKAPIPSVYTDRTRVNVGDTVTLFDVSQYCASSTRWEISPANYILVNGTSLNDKDIQVVFTANGFYDVKQVKANSFGADSITLTNYIQALNYCIPYTISLEGDIGISNVKLNTIDNTSKTGKASYSDYTHLVTTLEKGNIYALSLSRATNANKMSRKVWIDYNIDGNFDASELVLSESPSTTMTFTDSIFIPNTAGSGFTRMRVATSYKSDLNTACGPHQSGEFEDYGIILSDVDKTVPIITLQGSTVDTIEVFSTWLEPGFGATDRKDGVLTGKVNVSSTLDTSLVGEYTVTYNVQDAAGNSAITKSRTIYVVDRTAPTIALLGDDSVFVEIYGTYTEAGVTTVDNYDASLSAVINSNLDVNKLGTYTISYCVTDANNNGPICVSRTVVVGDTIAPIITLIGDSNIIVDVYTNYSDLGYAIADNDSANVVITSSGSWTGVPTVLGTFDLTYTATDAAGNSAKTTRTIEVVDRVAPTIELQGNLFDTVERWTAYTDELYTLSDNYYKENELSVSIGGDFENTQSEGTYFITYKVSDPSGNIASIVTRVIIVVQPKPNSIQEMSQIGIATYPNPNNGQFNLEVKLSSSQMIDVNIINTMGQVVAKIYSGNTMYLNQTVNLNYLPAGLYFINVNGSTTQKVERVTINK